MVTCLAAAAKLVLFATVAGNGQSDNNHSTVTKQSELPQRIVSLAPNLTEILYALGLGERIAGVCSESNYPAQAKQKEKIGSFWQPNIEAIIAAEPDLVITLDFEQQQQAARTLDNMGYNVLTVRLEKLNDLWESLLRIGRAVGSSEDAVTLAEKLQGQLPATESQVDDDKLPKVLFVVQSEPLRVAGRDTFINEIIEFAGGENAIPQTMQKYPQLGVEQIIGSQADVIIYMSMDGRTPEQQHEEALKFWQQWPSVPAVENDAIFVIDSDTIARIGPRVIDGIVTVSDYIEQAQADTAKERESE